MGDQSDEESDEEYVGALDTPTLLDFYKKCCMMDTDPAYRAINKLWLAISSGNMENIDARVARATQRAYVLIGTELKRRGIGFPINGS